MVAVRFAGPRGSDSIALMFSTQQPEHCGGDRMRRRAFMLLLGGAAVAAPLRGVAAQNDSVRRIAVLMPFDEGDPEGRHRLEVLREALRQLGWSDGRNLRIDVRWLAGDPAASARDRAAELVRLKPEVVLTASTPAVAAMSRATSTIPIVFASVADPVGSGFVQPCPAGWQCYRLCQFRSANGLEVARASQGAR